MSVSVMRKVVKQRSFSTMIDTVELDDYYKAPLRVLAVVMYRTRWLPVSCRYLPTRRVLLLWYRWLHVRGVSLPSALILIYCKFPPLLHTHSQVLRCFVCIFVSVLYFWFGCFVCTLDCSVCMFAYLLWGCSPRLVLGCNSYCAS